MSPKSVHVTKDPKGGWKVVPAKGKSIGTLETQKEAQNVGRDLLRNTGGGELVIHNRENLIRQKDTIAPAKDPYPPKG